MTKIIIFIMQIVFLHEAKLWYLRDKIFCNIAQRWDHVLPLTDHVICWVTALLRDIVENIQAFCHQSFVDWKLKDSLPPPGKEQYLR